MFGKPLVIALVCLISVVTPAQDTTNTNDGSKVLALESVWNRAEEKRDVKALGLILDDSMIYIDEDGSMLTKAQFLNRTAKQSGSDLQWLVTPAMSAHVYGNTAVVVGSYRAKGLRRGKPYQRDGRFVDTWAFKKGVWLCVAAQATPIMH
jgi:ketosteroid isomerase-like protein